MGRLAPAIVVLERRSRWESELKHRLKSDRILVRPCRTAADALALSRDMPGSVIVIDLESRPENGLILLGELAGLRLCSSPVVIGPAAVRELEWPARELGAVAFLPETVSGNELAAMCQRLLENVTRRPDRRGDERRLISDSAAV